MSQPALRRKKSFLLTPEERKVINRYKPQYKTLTDRTERHTLITTKILVDVFNYHSQQGRTFTDSDTEDLVKVYRYTPFL